MTKRLTKLLTALSLMILVTGCLWALPINGVKPLQLKHGWSPVRTMELNGQQVNVKCMTVEDAERVRNHIILLESLH